MKYALKKIFVSLLIFLGSVHGTLAQKPVILELWPNGAPTNSGITAEESLTPDQFVTHVTKPTLTVYPAQKPNGVCVICCPGGGYAGLAIIKEGSSYADWFNAHGITMVLLKYRMPNGHAEIPLNDSEQAIRMVREHAQEWGIDPHKIGIMGHSAGGHFAATLSTLYTSPETRPDFSILMYPVISMETGITHQGSRENLLGKNPTSEMVHRYNLDEQVHANTPPAILILATDDDIVPPVNSLRYYEALLKNQVKNSAMFIYPYGGHGFGFDDHYIFKREWTDELLHWIDVVTR